MQPERTELRARDMPPRARLGGLVALTGLLAGLLGALAGCAAADTPQRLEVYAAASLAEPFTELELVFEAAHPEIDVVHSFAGSQVLRVQIEHGAPAHVFASANPEHLRALELADLVGPHQVFAHNRLCLALPAANPAHIEGFEDFPRAERIVIGTPAVPVGRYARDALARASETLGAEFGPSVLARVVSQESNARLLRTKLELGEADAALLYRTDLPANSALRCLALPAFAEVRASYAISTASAAPEAALAYVTLLRSSPGRQVLAAHGFDLPE